jgi:hypothetical protein
MRGNQMEIWVRQVVNVTYGCYPVYLYIDKTRAYEDAMVSVNSLLFENRQKFQHCQAEWNFVLDSINQNRFEDAIDSFNELSRDFGDKSIVIVYQLQVIGSEGSSVLLEVADIPCRQCGRGVQPNDKECWWCTAKDPAAR